MIERIFSWVDWDIVDEFIYSFEKCTMAKDFGPLKQGQFVAMIVVNMQLGLIDFYMNNEDLVATYQVSVDLTPIEALEKVTSVKG